MGLKHQPYFTVQYMDEMRFGTIQIFELPSSVLEDLDDGRGSSTLVF
jgi:hypothetical protein